MLAYSGALSSNMLHIAALLPPIGASFTYCLLAVFFESLVGCSSILRRRMRPNRTPPPASELGIPLTFSAWTVTVLDLAEAVYAIYVFVAIGWRNHGFFLMEHAHVCRIFRGA
eukprot:g33595.t1